MIEILNWSFGKLIDFLIPSVVYPCASSQGVTRYYNKKSISPLLRPEVTKNYFISIVRILKRKIISDLYTIAKIHFPDMAILDWELVNSKIAFIFLLFSVNID